MRYCDSRHLTAPSAGPFGKTAVRLKRDPKRLYDQLNETYFDGLLPSSTVVRFVDFPGTGSAIDTRCDAAACTLGEDGVWIIELHRSLKDLGSDYMALTLAHEMVHIKHPKKARRHNAAVWGEEYRRLVGLGFFRSIF